MADSSEHDIKNIGALKDEVIADLNREAGGDIKGATKNVQAMVVGVIKLAQKIATMECPTLDMNAAKVIANSASSLNNIVDSVAKVFGDINNKFSTLANSTEGGKIDMTPLKGSVGVVLTLIKQIQRISTIPADEVGMISGAADMIAGIIGKDGTLYVLFGDVVNFFDYIKTDVYGRLDKVKTKDENGQDQNSNKVDLTPIKESVTAVLTLIKQIKRLELNDEDKIGTLDIQHVLNAIGKDGSLYVLFGDVVNFFDYIKTDVYGRLDKVKTKDENGQDQNSNKVDLTPIKESVTAVLTLIKQIKRLELNDEDKIGTLDIQHVLNAIGKDGSLYVLFGDVVNFFDYIKTGVYGRLDKVKTKDENGQDQNSNKVDLTPIKESVAAVLTLIKQIKRLELNDEDKLNLSLINELSGVLNEIVDDKGPLEAIFENFIKSKNSFNHIYKQLDKGKTKDENGQDQNSNKVDLTSVKESVTAVIGFIKQIKRIETLKSTDSVPDPDIIKNIKDAIDNSADVVLEMVSSIIVYQNKLKEDKYKLLKNDDGKVDLTPVKESIAAIIGFSKVFIKLEKIKPPHPLVLMKKIWTIDLALIIIKQGLFSILRTMDELTQILKSPYLTRSRVEAVDVILASAKDITQTIIDFPIIPRKLLRVKLKCVSEVLEDVVLGLIDITAAMEVLDELKMKSDQITEVTTALGATNELLKSYMKLSTYAMLIAPVMKITTKTLIGVVRSVLSVIVALNDLDAKSGEEKVDALKHIVISIVAACSTLAMAAPIILAASTMTGALKKFPKIAEAIVKSLDTISTINDIEDARQKAANLQKIVQSIAIICVEFVLLIPVLLAFTLASPAIIVSLLIFALICKTLVRVVDFILSCRLAMVMVEIAGMLLAMTAIALILITLSLVSEKAVRGLPMVGLLLLGIITLLGALALIGWITSTFNAVLLAGLAGVGIVTLAVVALLVMVLALRALQEIKLDPGKIKTNVGVVLSIAGFIISSLFESDVDEPGNKESGFLGMLTAIGGGALKIVEALAASVILVATFVSVGAILLMAGALRLLQELDLNPTDIHSNVRTILSEVEYIIGTLFADDSKNPKASKKGILLGIIDWVSPQLGKVLKAALGAAFLFLSMVSIGIVLAIAGMLRLIQEIELAPEKIDKNLSLIFEKTEQIIDKIYSPVDDSSKGSSHGLLTTIIGWVDKGLANVVSAALGVVYLFLSMVSIGIVLAIAGMLKLLQNIELAPEKIDQNITKIFDTVDGITKRVFAPAKDTPKPARGWLGKIINFFSPGLADITDALMKVANLAVIFMSVSVITGIAKKLNDISKINFKSADIDSRVDTIFNSSQRVMDAIVNNDIDISEDDSKSTIRSMKVAMDAMTHVDEMAQSIRKISDTSKGINFADAQNCAASSINVMGAIIAQVDNIKPSDNGENVRTNCDLMQLISSTIGSFVKVDDKDVRNSKSITENYIKFFDKVNSMDIRKLQHTDYIMRSWAAISRELQGNFQGLAQTISEHVMPMLDKLNKTMDGVNECQQSIIDELTQPVELSTGANGSLSTPSFPANNSSDNSTPSIPTNGNQLGTTANTQNFTTTFDNRNSKTDSQRPVAKFSQSSTPDIQTGKYYKVQFAEIKDA